MKNTVLKPVLLVDDNPDDALLMRRAWTKAQVQNALTHVADGEQAMTFLQKACHPGSESSLPALIFLDIKMPRMDGFETLKWIKSRPELTEVPVLMLTSSGMEPDLAKAKNLKVASYLVKPAAFADLLSLVQEIRRDWLEK